MNYGYTKAYPDPSTLRSRNGATCTMIAGDISFDPKHILTFFDEFELGIVHVGYTRFLPYLSEERRLPVMTWSTGRETNHAVFATLVRRGDSYAVDNDNNAIIILKTVACTSKKQVFPHKAYKRRGVQYNAVEIHDWSRVTFSAEFMQPNSIWAEVYDYLYADIYSDLQLRSYHWAR